MQQIPGYQLIEQLYSGSRTIVYRALSISSQTPVIIKFLQKDYPTFNELVQFRNQYTIGKNLNIPGTIKTYGLEFTQNRYILSMEDFGGISLAEYLSQRGASLSIEQFLNIACSLAQVLQSLHTERIIHKDIKPANILINPHTQEVKLTDFSISSLLPRETQEIQNPKVLEGTLAYISPEQTGRMNRGIDYRTDFYSLGVTFYEILTGQLPFISEEAMELLHCHLAKQAVPVHEIKPEIPVILSQIISKLMAKNAEDRYQSGFGLYHDLEICLTQLQKTGEIISFELGQRDITNAFIIPEKLYGRENEVAELLAVFDRVSDSSAEMMLVAGFSGIGKTAVVNEVHKPIVRQRGYFIKGKYDQFQRNIPFSAFVQAFRDLMGQLLSESVGQLQIWKDKILEAVGDNGQVLIEVIPELENILGKQPAASELSGSADQNRFNLLFQKFVQVFTSIEHPLVIFLDDLQWSDSASLNLLQILMRDTQHLLVLGAYRDNEVSPGHPFITTVVEMVKSGARVNTITLQPLSLEAMNRLVADTLNCSSNLAQPLTGLIHQKTKGNPFFATQFLKTLHQDGLISFNGNLRHWQCDIAEVRALAITDDVVEFMALQLQKLPIATQNMLKLAACVGAQFDLNTLAIISKKSAAVTATELWKSLQAGLIIPTTEVYKFFTQSDDDANFNISANPTYRFLHDRVQQAAYSLIPEDQKQATHLKIGQLLLQNLNDLEREEKLFDIVNHFNAAQSLLVKTSDREQVTQLNLMAGQKAKNSTAYRAAFEYLTIGMELLSKTCWQTQYDLTLLLHSEAAQVAYLGGQFVEMEAIAQIVLKTAKTLLDKINIYETQIQAYIAQKRLDRAIQIGQTTLRELGIRIPQQGSIPKILLELAKTKLILVGKKIPDLVQLPIMQSPKELAAMRILASTLSAAFLGAPKLFPILVCKQINLSLKHGNTALSASAYSSYGTILCGVLVDVEIGYQFGQLAIEVQEKLEARELRCKVSFMVNSGIRHWQDPVATTIVPLREGYQAGLDTGDIEYAAWSAVVIAAHLYYGGYRLVEIEPEVRNYAEAVNQFKQDNALIFLKVYHQAISNYLGQAANPTCLIGKYYSEETDLPLQIQAGDMGTVELVYIIQLELCYRFGDFSKALEKADLGQKYAEAAIGGLICTFLQFYDSLTQLAVYPSRPKSEQKKILQRVAANQKKMKKWAYFAPANHQYKYDLVEAEYHRVLGHQGAARELYDHSIQLTKENQFLNEEALANELAMKFYLELGKENIAQVYAIEAYYCYTRWGAKAKVIDLEQRYPQLLTPILQPQPQLQPSQRSETTPTYVLPSNLQTNLQSTHISSSRSISDNLDLATVLKVSQSISCEIELDKLIATLLQAVQENAGATKSALLLKNPENKTPENIELVALCENKITQIVKLPAANCTEVPIAVINYVNNTQETIVIDDMSTSATFTADPYLKNHLPQSLMCIPLVNQSKLIGMIYLENNLTINTFTNNRLALLQMLTSPVAIALENARLYQQAQNYAQQLEQSHLQIVQNEKMSALGNLVAGVAHEINNPVGFLGGNIKIALNYINDLFGLLELIQQTYPQLEPEIQAEMEAIELDYIREDLPKLIGSMNEGIKRIQDISTSLRTFSRADSDRPVAFNLHEGIDSTILILKHRLKADSNRPAVVVAKNYGQIPLVECYAGQLNQVFMNIIANAIDALDESNAGKSYTAIEQNPNSITITTSHEDDYVKIAIADNGKGMPEEVKQKIFDHLFTTKEVGKGTGLGLAIARQIIIEKHKGSLEVNSNPETGAEFVITLPI